MSSMYDGARLADAAEARLPRPPGVVRRALAAHPLAVDVFIVVWYVIGVGLGVMIDVIGAGCADSEALTCAQFMGVPGYLDWPWWPLAVVRVLVIGAALLYRRRYPLWGLIAIVVLQFGEHGVQSLATGVALLFLLYAVPVYRSVAAGWLGYAIAFVGSVAPMWVGGVDGLQGLSAGVWVGPVDDFEPIGMVFLTLMTGAWMLAVLLLGINLGNRRRYLEAVIDRAHQLARERDQLAQLAVAEERSRIAREMHDIVAHSVSVMIALSEGAARAAASAPDAAADAMARSAETGRAALAEMRRLLGAMHDPAEKQGDLVPQPGVDDLPELVRSFENAGVRVELTVTGEASGDRGQDLAVYRIAQEGLTNVLRYAGSGARAEVTVERRADRTIVNVRDHGRARGETGPVSGLGSGRGIAGLRERARVFGGEISAAPVAGGGWLLRADLPVNTEAREPQMRKGNA